MLKRTKAFTLIELLVSMVIIGVLATISIATFSGYFEKARMAKAIASAKQIENLFLTQNASSENELLSGYYDFNADTSQSMSNLLIDKSGMKNNMGAGGSGTYNQSDDTPTGIGKSAESKIKAFAKGAPQNPPSGKVTFSLWFKSNESTPNRFYLVYLTNSGGGSQGFRTDSSGRGSFYMNGNTIYAPKDIMLDGKWHHIVCSYGDDFMKLWVDGDLIGTMSVSPATFTVNRWYIGTYGPPFAGLVDDIMISPYAFDGVKLR